MKLQALLTFALMLIAVESHAQYGSLPEFNYGARGLALGQSAMISSRDALATAWNPASACSVERFTTTFARVGLAGQADLYSLGAMLPLRQRGTLGVSYFRLITADIALVDEYSNLTGTANFTQEHLLLTYSRALSRSWALGANAKFVWQSFTPKFASGPENVGIDLGVIYRAPAAHVLTRDLAFGFAIDNLVQPSLKLDKVREYLPREYRFILEKSIQHGEHRFLAVANLGAHEKTWRSGTEVQSRFGMEYSHRRLPSLRVGLHDNKMDIGFGVQFRALVLDYARIAMPAYEGSVSKHAWSLSCRL
ncbi:hypothetical protein HUU05_10795 [candidate division KSB1 bacterium]|nr:hypothetical protein [candidate division KSB1 bacterium]